MNRHRKLIKNMPPGSFCKQNDQVEDYIFVKDFVIIEGK